MKFKKFLVIFVILIISANIALTFEPILVFDYERSGERSNPLQNGDFYDYKSEGPSATVPCIIDGIPCEYPVHISLNLSIDDGHVQCHMNIQGCALKNVSNLGYHRFVNITRTYGLNSSYIQNFLNPANGSKKQCLSIDNQTLAFMCTEQCCAKYGYSGLSYEYALNSMSYGIDGSGFKGGPLFNGYSYARQSGENILLGINIFEGNSTFFYQMLNGLIFKNISLKGVNEMTFVLVKTNVELNPLDYTYYLLQNFNLNLLVSVFMVSFLLAVYVKVKRKNRRR